MSHLLQTVVPFLADTVPDEAKDNLSAQFADLDPVALLGHIDRLQDESRKPSEASRQRQLEGVLGGTPDQCLC